MGDAYGIGFEHVVLCVIPLQMIGGILFAVAYEMEKNLLAPITIHILGNLAIFILTLITWNDT